MSSDTSTEIPGVRELARVEAGEFERLFRQISTDDGQPEVRALLLGNHTLDPLAKRLAVCSHLNGVRVRVDTGPFNQYFQPFLSDQSPLDLPGTDAIVLSLSLSRLAPDLTSAFSVTEGDVRRTQCAGVLDHIEDWASVARERTGATLFIMNFWHPAIRHLGLVDGKVDMGEGEVYRFLNSELTRRFRGDPQAHIVDVDEAIARAGRIGSRDPRMNHLAKLEWQGMALDEVATLVTRHLRALVRPSRKCVVVDLDNTLWGGIVGEDGVEGIRIAEGDPVGEAHREFQRALLALKRRGVLLAISSKNNFSDAREVFERHAEMPLSWEDFAAHRINWDSKHESLRQIAEELNIGMDSLVFVDDNPAERELVRQLVPEVAVLPIDEDSAGYADSLLGSWWFDQLTLTEEDTRKTEHYRENAQRRETRVTVRDLATYLEGLDTRITIRPAVIADLNRVHQLFAKTNQFNLSTRRYRPAELEQFIRDESWDLSVVSAVDRFGDLGVIGAYLLERHEGTLVVDSLLLSCRAMGREIETAIANRIKEVARNTDGIQQIRGRFVPTKKNVPAADFFPRQGFEPISEVSSIEGEQWFGVDVGVDDQPCPWITVTD